MPLIKLNRDRLPSWSELDNIRILSPETELNIKITSPKFALFAVEGTCRIIFNMIDKVLIEGEQTSGETEEIKIIPEKDIPKLVLICGRWTQPAGNAGVFSMDNTLTPRNDGDPAAYNRTTLFDNHFHDCDEYWIITSGKGLAVSEGIMYPFGSGDCIATKMGDHHDLPEVFEEIKGVYFETTLKGQKRLGHLWKYKE